MKVEDLLQRTSWDVDPRPHIRLDASKCVACPTRACVRMCPAGCYTEVEGSIVFSYEGCLECGTCRVVCPMGAIEWNYPLSGRGVQYRLS
ncbi:MAG: ferredoxin family protein [Conexivisphaera sp.]